MSRFSGKAAIITGAASGIGRAALLRLASEGAFVLGLDRDTDGLAETDKLAKRVSTSKDHISIAAGSILDEKFVDAEIGDFSRMFGGLDVLINMAGILRFSRTANMPLDGFLDIINLNLGGTFLLCQKALPHLIQRKGSIVNAASTSALFGHPYVAAYAASKGGIISLTRSLAWEFMREGVRVNAVAPGAIATPMQSAFSAIANDIDPALFTRLALPDGKVGEAADVASVIAMLASDDARHINGEVIRIDGGLHS